MVLINLGRHRYKKSMIGIINVMRKNDRYDQYHEEKTQSPSSRYSNNYMIGIINVVRKKRPVSFT